MSLSKKYPYMMAWIGYVTILFVTGIIIGIISKSSLYYATIASMSQPIIGFIALEVVTKRFLIPKHDPFTTFINNTAFFIAWLGITIWGLLLNSTFYTPIIQLSENPLLFGLIYLALWLYIDFFVFRFIVKKYIVDESNRHTDKHVFFSLSSAPLRFNNWRTIGRIILKTAVLLLLLNAIFAALYPMEALGHVSLYNSLLRGRERLPYGENPAESYNLSTFNVPAMFASHSLQQPKAADEFRVLLIGDSGTWGWFLENEDTLAAQLNGMGLETDNGRSVKVYNLGYPVMALTKDIMLLEEAMNYDLDLILWPVTLESFPRDKQIFPPLVQNNPERVRQLISDYGLNLDAQDGRFTDPTFLDRTIIGQRRNLANLLRLQAYGFSWAATGIDQAIPDDIPQRTSDFDEDLSWQTFTEPTTLTTDDLAFDVLSAGMEIAGDVPILLINEPMFISDGENSDLRYNAFYPHWAYDQYRELLAETAVVQNWPYLDLWNSIPPEEFTDTPVHLNSEGNRLYAEQITPALQTFLQN